MVSSRVRQAVLAIVAFLLPAVAGAQQPPGPSPSGTSSAGSPVAPAMPPREAAQDLMAKLTPEQRGQFADMTSASVHGHHAAALAISKELLAAFPGDPVLSRIAADASLKIVTGADAAADSDANRFAIVTLKPIAERDPDDWLAAELLTRACAQAGDAACRDAGMAHMLDLHKRGVIPGNRDRYLLERLKASDKTVVIYNSLEPWSKFHVYDVADVYGADDKVVLRVTLETDDFDQPLFKQQYPDLATKGERRFSMDGYSEATADDGKRTLRHFTYGFFDGQPSYDTFRSQLVKIVTGEIRAHSSSEVPRPPATSKPATNQPAPPAQPQPAPPPPAAPQP